MAGIDNLKPLTTEKAREIGRAGGLASVKARKEKKLMSQIYAEVLSEIYDEPDPDKNIKGIIKRVLDRGDSSSVSLIKELREGSEGSKINFNDISEGRLTLLDYADKEDVENGINNL
jgi:hypothetical protein